ncbi:MAG TPA: hypothetical protein VJ914_15830 [Pseudonocardiaceae bacterium]|nr:hypothetical protein [Pseudonocardiaceae bacterium]
MSSARRRPATIAATLAAITRDLRRTIRAADPSRPPGLVPLRDTGWQLTQLTGELTDLAALLAEHTGQHSERAAQLRRADGESATDRLACACRELAALRRALDAAHTAARDYYTAISHLAPNQAPGAPSMP